VRVRWDELAGCLVTFLAILFAAALAVAFMLVPVHFLGSDTTWGVAWFFGSFAVIVAAVIIAAFTERKP
jgi:hypothetical protein